MDNEKKKYGLPDPMAPFSEKLTDEFGLKIGKLISSDWFDASGFATGNCAYITRRDYVRDKRLFVRGEGNTKIYKSPYNQRDGALDTVSVDFSLLNWAEKFCRVVSGGISDENYVLDIRAVDRLSVMQKETRRDDIIKQMVSRHMLEKAMKLHGINLMQPGLPESEEELDVHMEIKERPKIEIAEELLINFVLKTNNWDFLSKEYNKELVDVGLVVARVYTDKNDGIKLDWVDSENYVHSKVKKNDFSDKIYEGVVDTVTISDIRRESDFDEKTLTAIAKLHNTSLRNDWDTCGYDDIVDYKVDVLRFAYKTSKKIVYKKSVRKGETIKLRTMDDSWKDKGKERYEKVLDTWMEGNYILGSDYIYCYKECENLYDDVMNKAMSPFITFAHKIYENRLQSFATNIEVPARMLQRISNKIQHLVNEIKPDGIEIDYDMLAELDTKYTTMDAALNLYESKGVIFSKRVDMGEMGIKDKAAVRPFTYEQGTALVKLLQTWTHYYNLIRENTGVNPARDGSLSPDALVGVSELAQLSSNTVTKDIVDISVAFKKKICETISSRLKTIFKYSDAKHLKEIYTNVVGKEMLDAMSVLKNRHLHEFGFTYEMYPTVKAVQELKEDLSLALQSGSIDVYVKSETAMIARSNIKLANQFLNSQIKKLKKEKAEAEKQMLTHKSQNDAAAAQAAEQARVQSYSAQAMIDVEKEAKLSQIRVSEAYALKQMEIPETERSYQHDLHMQQIKSIGEAGIKKYLEDRKDLRTEKQATQQSDLKYQAQTGGQPIDFEAQSLLFSDDE
jgi:hypothetical protein